MAQQDRTFPYDTASAAYKAYVLFILIVVYTFNFIDRQIVAILSVPIKEDLQLSDTELGLMTGFAFAFFYTLLGVPVARLADRTNRTLIMTAALTIWSGFTALCGAATNFIQIFLFRMGVGVGEAGGVAPAYAIISDLFPQNQRARALAIYSFGIPIGSALGLLLGGYIAETINWRVAFFAVGIAGVALAPIFYLTVREPRRGVYDGVSASAPPPSTVEVLRLLASKPSFWLLSFGAGCSSIMGYGLLIWLPSFFERSYGLSLFEVSLFFGGIILIGGVAGIALGGVLADWFGETRKSAYALVPATALLLSMPCYVLGILSDDLWATFFLFLLPQALGLVWIGPVLSAVQHLVTPGMRATASASFLFINNLIGYGGGPVLIGVLSDSLSVTYGEDSLRYAILAGTGFYVLSAGLFFFCARWLDRDWVR